MTRPTWVTSWNTPCCPTTASWNGSRRPGTSRRKRSSPGIETRASNFAETKNGIISALKVFFNQDVVRATSGLPTETTQLEECFRQPSLVMVGINQKNMMDGSGEVLFRLYKRLLDAAAMRVAAEQGGRLRVHLAYMMDELPSIGKINYMMRSLGTLRSYNISHHLGIQNDAQGQLVYGEAYWKAITTNVVARVIVFPRGINGDDAKKIRDLIGKTTATEVGVTGSRSIRVLEHEGSNAVSAKLVERDLLSYEEFSQFTLGEAVVRVNGHQPIRTQLAPMTMATVEEVASSQGRSPTCCTGSTRRPSRVARAAWWRTRPGSFRMVRSQMPPVHHPSRAPRVLRPRQRHRKLRARRGVPPICRSLKWCSGSGHA